MPKYLLFLLLLMLFNCSDNKQGQYPTDNHNQTVDTIKYVYKGFNHKINLFLLNDQNFINEEYTFSCFGDGEIKKVYGRYEKNETQLMLFPKTIDLTIYEEYPGQPQKYEMEYGVDSLRIKAKFDIILWGQTEYLLSDVSDSLIYGWGSNKENDYLRFVNALNSGYEPKNQSRYLASENHKSDSIRPPFDYDKIPEPWRKYFFKEPLSLKIERITNKFYLDYHGEKHTYRYIQLDKGEESGVYEELTFTTKDEGLYIRIDSVTKNKSYGKSYQYNFSLKKFPTGTELRTRWE